MGGQNITPPTDVSSADHSRAQNATVKAYVRPKIKKPEDDAMISANRDRIKKARMGLPRRVGKCTRVEATGGCGDVT